jgi:hypothetical protein
MGVASARVSEHRDDLVELEGVNAASADGAAESDPPPGLDARSGGQPEDAPDVEPDDEARGDEMVGTPRTLPEDPSQPAGPPGQDSGSAQ